MKTSELQQHLINMTINHALTYAKHNGIKFDPNKAKEYMKNTMVERFGLITKEVQSDAKEADFLGGGIKNPLVKQVTNVSLTHGLVMYAKDIVDNCKL